MEQLKAAAKAEGVAAPQSLDLAILRRSLIEIDDLVAQSLSSPSEVKGWKEAVSRALGASQLAAADLSQLA